MSSNSRVSDSYAYAFFKILSEEKLGFNCFSGLISDIIDVLSLLNISNSFGSFLANPIYDSKRKKQLLHDFLSDSLSPMVMNFLNLLCDTKRIINVNSIFNSLLEIIIKRINSYIVEIEVSDDNNYKLDMSKLYTILANWFSSKRTPEDFNQVYFFLDPLIIFTVKKMQNLIGGFKLNLITESKVIDFSITGKIQKITKILELEY
jgi:F0F1-type ATP synthase delta subunit